MLLFAARAGVLRAQTEADSTAVNNDSITWNSELDGITVKAQRQLVKQEIDRVGYDVQADDDSKTLTVLDMLRKVPMVTVDGQDNIFVKGNRSFKVYKNGHLDPSLTRNAKEMLKAMPASMVKRIEVITDPGSREDAEGVDAILNIVMMDGSRLGGMTGIVNLYYNTHRHPNLYTSLTGQLGRLMLSGNYGYGGMTARETEVSSDVRRTFMSSGNLLTSHSDSRSPGGIHYGNLDASYDIDSLNLISASFGGYFYNLDAQGERMFTLEAPIREGDLHRDIIYSYNNRYWMPGYSHHSWNGRVDYEHKTHVKGERLTLSYMIALTRQHTDDESTYSDMQNAPFAYTGSLQTARERFTEHTLQADWLRPLGKGHRIEVGTKYIDRSNNSHNTAHFTFDTPTEGQDTDNQFSHTTRVLGIYADYIYNNVKWSARAGMRYEHSYMRGSYPDGQGETFRHSMGDWVPQASVKYQLSDNQSLKLTYTTSINRPGIAYLNPAVVTSPTIVQQGNAQLGSSRLQRISLVYMFVGEKLTLQVAPGFQFVNNGIASVQTAQGDVRYLTYGNVQRFRHASMDQYVQWQPFEGTSLIVNNAIRYDHYRNPNLGYGNFGWSDSYYVGLTQSLPLKMKLSLSVYGDIGHRPTSVYYTQHSSYGYYFSLQRSFLRDDRLTLRIVANSPFNSRQKWAADAVNGDFRDLGVSSQHVRQVAISLSFRFGKLKESVKKTETTIDNTDEVGGIMKGN